jgi:hypothetical protein
VVAFHDLKMSYRSRKAGHVVVDDGVEGFDDAKSRTLVDVGDSGEVERFDDEVERLSAFGDVDDVERRR